MTRGRRTTRRLCHASACLTRVCENTFRRGIVRRATLRTVRTRQSDWKIIIITITIISKQYYRDKRALTWLSRASWLKTIGTYWRKRFVKWVEVRFFYFISYTLLVRFWLELSPLTKNDCLISRTAIRYSVRFRFLCIQASFFIYFIPLSLFLFFVFLWLLLFFSDMIIIINNNTLYFVLLKLDFWNFNFVNIVCWCLHESIISKFKWIKLYYYFILSLSQLT